MLPQKGNNVLIIDLDDAWKSIRIRKKSVRNYFTAASNFDQPEVEYKICRATHIFILWKNWDVIYVSNNVIDLLIVESIN